MSEETRKVDQTEPEAQASEISDEDLETVAGGVAGGTQNSGCCPVNPVKTQSCPGGGAV